MKPKEILERIAKLEKELATLKARVNIKPPQKTKNLEPKFEVPELKRKYWVADASGDVFSFYFRNDIVDNQRLKQGNVFLTEKDCQKQSIYNELRAKYVAYVKEYNGDWVADLDNHAQEKFQLYYNAMQKKLLSMSNYVSVMTDLAFVFKDKDLLPFVQKRMTDVEIRAVINHDLSCIEVEN